MCTSGPLPARDLSVFTRVRPDCHECQFSGFALAALCLPRLASACWDQAAQKHAVSADLLVAVARAESSLNPRAVNRSHIARANTVDIGMMQINSDEKMLRNLGVTREELLDPCTNIDDRVPNRKRVDRGFAVGVVRRQRTAQQCWRRFNLIEK